jgi:hypothetical protein
MNRNPYVNNGAVVPLTVALADPVEEQTLHMVNTDPNRTPTFTMFGIPEYFFQTSNPSCGGNPCVNPTFAWNHGDIQDEIADTWVGMVGPGVEHHNVYDQVWTDHTDVRPTIMTLTGLKDDYETDGRTITEILKGDAMPNTLNGQKLERLGAVYKQLDAAFGEFAHNTLLASTSAVKSTDETRYESIESQIQSLTSQRDALADQIRTGLNNAEFNGANLDNKQVKDWTKQAEDLIKQSAALAASSG